MRTIEFMLVQRQVMFYRIGVVLQVSWADRFVGILGTLFCRVLFYLQMAGTGAIFFQDELARSIDRLWSQTDRVGTHIGDQTFRPSLPRSTPS